MVLNSGGGNKGKHVARKFIKQAAGGTNKAVRVARDDGEMYAVVSKMFGNCMCGVACYDGRTRLCIIRKKFTGRRKTDNMVASGSLVLVGVHAYGLGTGGGSGGSGGKGAPVQRCDLLYVYTDQEREKLRKVCDVSKLTAAVPGAPADGDDDGIKFVTSGTGVFNKYANPNTRSGSAAVAVVCANSTDSAAIAALEAAITINGADWLKDMYPETDDDSDNSDNSDNADNSDNSEVKCDSPDSDTCRDAADKWTVPQQRPPQSQQSQLSRGRPRTDVISVDDI